MRLLNKVILSVYSLLCCMSIMAQGNDVPSVSHVEIQNYVDTVQRDKFLRQSQTLNTSVWRSVQLSAFDAVADKTTLPKMTYEFSMQKAPSALFQWDNGMLFGTNSQSYANLWGYFSSAGMQLIQDIGDRWQLAGGAELQKYGSGYNTFSMNASATYRIGDNVFGTGFGSYESPSFLSSSHLGMGYQYGGYLTFETNNHKWGMDVGVRHGFSPWTGKHYTVPIARPYYKLGNSKIGIDLGGLFRSTDDSPPIFVPRKK